MNHEQVRRKIIEGHLLIGFLLVFAYSFSLHAQSKTDSTERVHFWANLGFGAASRGLAANGSINIQYSQLLFTIHSSSDSKFFGESLGNYGMLIGITNRASRFHYSFSAGIASVQRGESKYLDPIRYTSRRVGFPLEAQIFIRPTHFFGVGICAFLVLSQLGNMVGFTISVQLGSLM